MDLTIPIQFNEEELKRLIEEAVEKLKAEGYIWKDKPKDKPKIYNWEVLIDGG